MKPDAALLESTVERLGRHREQAPVYGIAERGIDEIEKRALAVARRFGRLHGLGEMRHERRRGRRRTLLRLQENVRACVYHGSGAISLDAGLGPMDAIVAADAERANEKDLRRGADEALKGLEVRYLPIEEEELHFERLWRLKASGITEQGERGSTALTRVVGSYRRHIGPLPVFGRASAFVEIAAKGRPAAAGIDWRPVAEKPIDETAILSPEEGAARVLAELQRFNPDRKVTQEDYTPERFDLGYFSLPKRRHQAVMQPTFVAMFKPTGSFPSIGRVIVVPAAPHAYEPIARPRAIPPVKGRRRVQEGA